MYVGIKYIVSDSNIHCRYGYSNSVHTHIHTHIYANACTDSHNVNLHVCVFVFGIYMHEAHQESGWRALAILPSVTFAQGEAGQQIRPELTGFWF